MLRVLSCLGQEHDHAFVAVAAIVCIVGAAMTMQLFGRGRHLSSRRSAWILLCGVAGGTAIWTTHFVAMLGFRPPVDYSYEPALTLLSLIMPIGFTAAGLHIASRTGRPGLAEAGGAVMGIGISVMHFTGMQGLQVSGRVHWDWDLVAASVIFGIVFGALTTSLSVRGSGRRARWGAGAALVFAICGMHFTAMGAASFEPGAVTVASPLAVSSELVALGVVATISVVTGVTLYFIDARSKHELIAGFRHAALHDPLTGMANRASLSLQLPQMLADAQAAGRKVALIVVDLDRFKDVNDVHGHDVGDKLLRALSSRLSEILGPSEFLARVGGDEFVGVCTDVASPAEAEAFAQRLAACVAAPVVQADRVLSVGSSIGVSLYPDHSRDAEELIAFADLAMYRAKKNPGRKICFYDRSMDENRRKQSALAMELRHAVERDELELHYQPQIEVASGRVIGFEALVRWRHPQRGLVSPAEFIPIAEETGLILPIGEWVLRAACAEAAGWPPRLKVAVNIASAQLMQGDLARLVHEVLIDTGLAASRLELEITEASIIDDHQLVLHVVRQLKALGVTIAMDDYGTGYSSLSTLQTFPFDKLKIDRSLVDGVTSSRASAAIVRATILMATDLGIPVLAEGVESREHLEFLRAEGCTEAQGYLFGRPQPISALAAVLQGRAMLDRPQPMRRKRIPLPRAV